MIDALILAINEAFFVPGPTAFGAALVWGVLAVLLSPCHLGAIPLIVAWINSGEKAGRKRAFILSLLFAAGLLVTLAVMGFVTSALGRIMGDTGPALTVAVAIFLILCGLWLMDVPPLSGISFSFSMKNDGRRRGPLGSFLLGLVYGVILGPCSFAFLAPMLGLIFAAGAGTVAFGAALMGFYALGHTAAIVAAGTFGDLVEGFLRSRGSGQAATWFRRILGAVVVLAGILQVIGVLERSGRL